MPTPNAWTRAAIFALLACSLMPVSAAAQGAAPVDEDSFPTPEQWSTILWESSDRFRQARHEHRAGLASLREGDRDEADRHLSTAISMDWEYPEAHFDLARMQAQSGNPSALGAWLDGIFTSFIGFPQQTLVAANALVVFDLVVAGVLLWVVLILFFRYAPFLQHQLAGYMDPWAHQRHRNRLLLVPVMLPLVLGLGLIPTLALVLPVVWIYSRRRTRVIVGLMVGWFALQGLYPGPLGTILVGLDPLSAPSLVVRAGKDPPSPTLLAQVNTALRAQPDDADFLFARGLAMARAGRFEDSTRSFLACLEREPNRAAAINNVGCNHYYLGDVDRAVAGFQKAAAVDSTLGIVHHNLSQAYIRKLYLREGSEAMRRSVRHGFDVQSEAEPLPRGAVYYAKPTERDLWAMAWHAGDETPPHALIPAAGRWLGVPPDHAGLWLAISLALSAILGATLPRKRLTFECANCGTLSCHNCRGEHEGAVLCHECAAHAKRARSELVLSTLLRNRRIEADVIFNRKLRRMNTWLLGAGWIYDGLQSRGLNTATAFVSLAVAAWLSTWPLQDPWHTIEPPLLNGVRIVAMAGIVFMLIVNWLGRIPGGGRKLHLHPASLVSLVDLIDGRSRRKLEA